MLRGRSCQFGIQIGVRSSGFSRVGQERFMDEGTLLLAQPAIDRFPGQIRRRPSGPLGLGAKPPIQNCRQGNVQVLHVLPRHGVIPAINYGIVVGKVNRDRISPGPLVLVGWIEKSGQRRRRYYRITAAGRRVLASQRADWGRFLAALAAVAGVRPSAS